MIVQFIIWGALVPFLVVALPLAAAWWPGRDDSRAPSPWRGPWVAGVAVGLGYAVAQWAMPGAPGPMAVDVGGRLVYLGAAGALLGVWETYPAIRNSAINRWARWLVRLIAATGASLLMVGPRAESAAWSVGTHVGMIAAISGAIVWVWTVVEIQARDERGPQLTLGLIGLSGASAVALVLSGTASTGQLAGLLTAGLAAVFLLIWRFPDSGRLRSAAPAVALIAVGQWTIGLHYASMPPATFALLAIAPSALLVARLSAWRRARASVGLAVRVAILALPLGLAVGTAAKTYFAEPAAETTPTGDNEDYGY